MALQCPACGQARLVIQASVELPPDHRSDERTIQALRCAGCDFTAIGRYEESRRGRLDDESWFHLGYPAPPEAIATLKRLASACPNPRKPRCKCSSHRRLDRALDEDDSVLPGVDWSHPFAIQLA